ncbi:MAG: hypothetical protein ACI3XR_02265 [Eubacteriales bacterium]
MDHYEMPIGLGMALAQNPEAMEKFVGLSDEKKQAFIEGCHSVKSKEEMHRYVQTLLSKG